MPWFRLDDKGAFHAKVLAAGNEAYGAWCRAGQWSSERLTDGFVPQDVALAIAPMKVWHRLRDAKAGHEHGMVVAREGGWQIHDFLVYNPCAAAVLADREAKREAGKRGGMAKAARLAGAVAPAVAPARQSLQQPPKHLLKQNPTPDPDPLPDPHLNKPPRAREGLPEAHDPGDPVQLELIAELAQHRAYAGHDLAAHAGKIASFAQGNGKPWGRYAEWYLATIRRVADKVEGADAAGKPWPAESVGSYLTQACRQPSDPASFGAPEPRTIRAGRSSPQDNDTETAKRILASQAKDDAEVPF